ncbi:MAG: hypothetical protein LCI03_05845 [Actinobacteria bacterium]|jgi:hypothetical protein|nr:hypothetical protein [Actinomycetota bacterium]
MFSRLIYGVHRFEPRHTVSPAQYLAGAQLYGGPESVLSGAAILRRRGLKAAFRPAFGLENEALLLVDHVARRSSRDFVVVERTRSLPVARNDGLLRVAPMYRAVLDACRRCTDEEAVQALIFEVVQRRLASPEALNDERIKGQKRGSRFARLALEAVFAGARSVPEARLPELLDAVGLSRMVLNPQIHLLDGTFLACPDAYDPATGVALEIDSREYHFGVESWEATMRRHARMTAHGLSVIHASPRRLDGDHEAVLDEVWTAIRSAAGRPAPSVLVTPCAR